MEEDLVEIDENTILSVKWGIVKYSAIFIVFVFVPLLINVLTSNSLSKFNVFALFVAVTLICIDQVVNLSAFLLAVEYTFEEEETEERN